MRVLHCIYDDPHNPWVAGGGAVRVREIYRRLSEQVDVTVATGNYPGAENGTVDGIRYLRLGAARPYALSRWSYARAASRLLRDAVYDAAVFDFSAYTPIVVPRDRPVGITVHHVTGPTAAERWGRMAGGALGRAERWMLRRGRRFSATSEATFAELRRIVPAGVPIDRVYAGVPDALFGLEREPGDSLLFFGRLDWFQKGLDTLLAAFARLVRERPELRLRIAGRGKDAARVQARVRELDLSERVVLLGAVTDEERQALFAEAAVQLMPSRFEGFGMVAAEAMAAGVPLVAAAVGSLPEVVAPPEGGRLVPPNDPEALAATVADLLDHPEHRAALSRSARASAERFRWSRVAEAHLEFLRAIARSA